MRQICLSTINTDLTVEDAKKAIRDNMIMQITNASQMVKLEKDRYGAFALIIDGKALAYALEDETENLFLSLAVDCAAVICCRVSPKQKLLVARLVKEGTGKTTLAICDGANDVGIIQEADIGVGTCAVGGMQAVMASDFSIAQFRFLERLLVVHGHWCYMRFAQMIMSASELKSIPKKMKEEVPAISMTNVEIEKKIPLVTEDGSTDRKGNPIKAKTGRWNSAILLLANCQSCWEQE